MEFIFLHPPYLQRWAGAENGAPLYNSLGFVDGAIARTCRPALNKRVVYSRHTREHGVKFQSMVLSNAFIINLGVQWEGRRHDCVLCFMNRVY